MTSNWSAAGRGASPVVETAEVDRGILGTLLDFCTFLRENELAVGTDDAMAFASAAAILDPTKMEDLYWAGRVTCVHGRLRFRSTTPALPGSSSVARSTGVIGECRLALSHPERSMRWLTYLQVSNPRTATKSKKRGLDLLPRPSWLTTRSRSRNARKKNSTRCVGSSRPCGPPRQSVGPAATAAPHLAGVSICGRWREKRCAPTESPGDLWWRKRRERPRSLVLILDISGSMADYSRNLLQFAHSTRRATSRVEVFCFGTRLTRITPSLRRRSPDEALERAGEEVVDWAGGTRIGASLDEFVRRYARRGLARGAFVIICSDGLDRGDPALLDDALERLGRLSHRIIWVNPMKGDAEEFIPTSLGMSVAMPHVDLVWSGHNLASLEAFAEALPSIK